jgi:hypothetical protein
VLGINPIRVAVCGEEELGLGLDRRYTLLFVLAAK